VTVEQSVVSVEEWALRQRLAPLRERELRQALRRNGDLSEPTVEMLLDRAEDAVIRAAQRDADQIGDRELTTWLREALRVGIKDYRRTRAGSALVDRYEIATETVAACRSQAPERAVAIEIARIEREFEETLTERERHVEHLQRAGVPMAQIRRELGVKRADVRAVQYAIDVKRDLFDHELATGELCAVRQRFIALAAQGAAGVRMRALVGLHVAWCPSCRPVLAISMREGARRALGVLAPVPPMLERAWRRAGGMLRPSGGTRVGELLAARIPETLGSAGGVCATAGACALLAGGTVVGVRAVDLAASTPPRHKEHHDARVHHQITRAPIARPAGTVSVPVHALTTPPTTGSTPTQTTTPASAATVAARTAAARRAAARKKAAAAQIARATGQFGQPGVVEGNSSSPAPVVSADVASAQSSSPSSRSSTRASSGATSGSGSSTHSSTSSSGQPSQFFTP
jgi:hypothetical protein